MVCFMGPLSTPLCGLHKLYRQRKVSGKSERVIGQSTATPKKPFSVRAPTRARPTSLSAMVAERSSTRCFSACANTGQVIPVHVETTVRECGRPRSFMPCNARHKYFEECAVSTRLNLESTNKRTRMPIPPACPASAPRRLGRASLRAWFGFRGSPRTFRAPSTSRWPHCTAQRWRLRWGDKNLRAAARAQHTNHRRQICADLAC